MGLIYFKLMYNFAKRDCLCGIVQAVSNAGKKRGKQFFFLVSVRDLLLISSHTILVILEFLLQSTIPEKLSAIKVKDVKNICFIPILSFGIADIVFCFRYLIVSDTACDGHQKSLMYRYMFRQETERKEWRKVNMWSRKRNEDSMKCFSTW